VVTREELYEAVWSKTLKALAQEWNTTREQLLLACKRMEGDKVREAITSLLVGG